MSSKGVLRVALLAGGTSSEREVSLKGAKAVKEALIELGHKVEFFDPAYDLVKLAQRAKDFDVAFLVIHGPGGEDGTLQGFLEMIGLPYQGAQVLGSALAMHKGLSKILYERAGLPVPKGFLFKKEDKMETIYEVANKLGYPLIVKPATQGSSIGLSLVEDSSLLKEALEKAFEIDNEILLEEYIKGRELTVGVLDDKPLPVVEILPKSKFFDYETKYIPGMAEEICPANISEELTKTAQNYALKAHKALYLRHYSRTDMILRDNEIFVLETNTIPGMTETSLLPLAAKVAGYSFKALIQKLLDLALENT
ncbi:MAG: D-alanine--D-alanine ligase [Caldimicrobium thiodismutans]|jgi:D-alanine-D-alanine ligase|uniref:D-alanine--D-alanine ligase n=1 Tax=Caldimicrobium thiodismutans TaxID=1653476 RepID=A0A2N7PJV8_9BACT|nr:MAG: D-alanine--D-alanine ligase [Caldimicrobium thiodismutans]